MNAKDEDREILSTVLFLLAILTFLGTIVGIGLIVIAKLSR